MGFHSPSCSTRVAEVHHSHEHVAPAHTPTGDKLNTACKLCNAAAAFEERYPNDYSSDDVKGVAKEYGFSPAQLRTRLGMAGATRNDWDEARVTRLKDLVDAGTTMTDIAAEFGVSVPRIKQIIKDKNIDTSKGDSERFQAEVTAAAELTERILAVYKADRSQSVELIASKAETDSGIVRRVLTSLGLPVVKAPTDDRVEVDSAPDEDTSARFVANFMSETGEEAIDKYIEWAKKYPEAPSGTYVRKLFGSWASARKHAEGLLGV